MKNLNSSSRKTERTIFFPFIPLILAFAFLVLGLLVVVIAGRLNNFLYSGLLVLIMALGVFVLAYFLITRPVKQIVQNRNRSKVKVYFETKKIAAYAEEQLEQAKGMVRQKSESENRLRRLIAKLEQEIEKRAVRLIKIENLFRKSAEDKRHLLDQVRKLTDIIEQSPASIVITDLNGTMEYVNPRFTQVTGYTFDESVGQNPRILKSGDFAKQDYEELWHTITQGNVWRGEFHNKKKNGQLYWEFALIAPIKSEDGSIKHFFAIKEEITHRKETEQANLMFANALQSIGEIVTITDMENHLLYINKAFSKVYEYEENEILGKDAAILLADGNPEWIYQKTFKDALMKGWSGELLNRAGSGRVFPVFLTTSVIRDGKGKTIAVVGIARDMSKEKHASEQEKKTEMLKTTQELAAAVSHEFAQPLQALSNYLGLMKMGKDKDLYFGKIEESITRISGLVKNLREITNIQRQDYLDTQIIDIKASSQKIQGHDKPSILVVDDEQDIRETLTEMLSIAGYVCDGARDGMEALSLVSKNEYGLILSDVNMPRMSGAALFDKLKNINYSGAFIFMTGYDMGKDTEKIVQKGDGLLQKPVQSKTLLKIIEEIFSA